MAGATPGMAPPDAPRRQPSATQQAVSAYRLDGVFGAGGVKTAIPTEPGAQQQLVAANQLDRDASHERAVRFNKVSMLVASWPLSHSAAPGRAMTTMSTVGSSVPSLRNDSLTRRFIRLRCTAERETLRDTARPRRAAGPAPGATTMVKQGSPRRRPDLNTRVNSAGERSRWARVKPCCRTGAASSFLAVVPADRFSDSEAGAALGAPARQHLTAIPGRHPGPEAMRPLASQIARLIGAFHRAVSIENGSGTNPARACQKDGKSYASPRGLSTGAAATASAGGAVDNPAVAR